MDRLGTCSVGNVHNMIHLEIGLARSRRSDEVGFVHDLGMFGIPVCLTVHSHCSDSQAPSCFGDSAGNLTSVGNYNFCKHFLVFYNIGIYCG